MVAPALVVAIIAAMIAGGNLINIAANNSQGLDADQCYVVFKHSKVSLGVNINFKGEDGEDNYNSEEFSDEHDGTFERISNGSPLKYMSVESKQFSCINKIFLHCGKSAGASDKAMVDIDWNHFADRLVKDKKDPGPYVCGQEFKGLRIGGDNGLGKFVVRRSALDCKPGDSACIVKNIEVHLK